MVLAGSGFFWRKKMLYSSAQARKILSRLNLDIPFNSMNFYRQTGIVSPTGNPSTYYPEWRESDIVALALLKAGRDAGVPLPWLRRALKVLAIASEPSWYHENSRCIIVVTRKASWLIYDAEKSKILTKALEGEICCSIEVSEAAKRVREACQAEAAGATTH